MFIQSTSFLQIKCYRPHFNFEQISDKDMHSGWVKYDFLCKINNRIRKTIKLNDENNYELSL